MTKPARRPSLRGPLYAGFLVGFKQKTLANFLFGVFGLFGSLEAKRWPLGASKVPSTSLGGPGAAEGTAGAARVARSTGLGSRRRRLPRTGTKFPFVVQAPAASRWLRHFLIAPVGPGSSSLCAGLWFPLLALVGQPWGLRGDLPHVCVRRSQLHFAGPRVHIATGLQLPCAGS